MAFDSKTKYRTPNNFRRNKKHKIAKLKIHGKIKQNDKERQQTNQDQA